MKHLYVFCEGSSEQGFCVQVLTPHLFPLDTVVHTIKIANSRSHGRTTRGGVSNYKVIANDIRNELKAHQGQDACFSTMIDLYALPSDFPAPDYALNPDNPYPYISGLEKQFFQDIGDTRFIPYIQLFEFETLLFADTDKFASFFEKPENGVQHLKRIVKQYGGLIEHIDDIATTHPKARIKGAFPSYRESSHGPEIANEIGLPVLRAKCPHFNEWVTKLENL